MLRIRQDMQEGNFHSLESTPVVVDEDGLLHNGRHRLEALVREGKTYPFWVMHASNEAAARWDVVGDNAAAWSLTDHLRHMGAKEPSVTSSALSYLHRLYEGTILHQTVPTRSQAIRLHEANKDVSDYTQLVRTACKEYKLPVGLGTAMAYVTGRLPGVTAEDVLDFWHTLAGLGSSDPEIVATAVTDLEHGHPLLALSSWLNRTRPSPRGGGRRPENLTWAIMIKAWDAYITQEAWQRPRWGRKEKFPSLVSADGSMFPAGSDQLRQLLEN
jgi:hypothetical protein